MNDFPIIRQRFKTARFVHIIRDGRDAVISIRERWWSPKTLAEQVQMWSTHVRQARLDGLGHPDYLELRYENLIMQPETELRRICQHIELEFNETMLHHERNAVERLNELKGIQTKEFLITDERRRQGFINSTRQPDKNLIGKWKNVLTVAEQEEFLELAGDLLSELGYDTGIYIPVH